MRILVVDDVEDSRDLTEAALLSAGYTDIVTAASGWETLKILDVGRTNDERPPFDVVLLDIVMPEMDGIEACARIRNDPRYADLPIIMVTALDDMDSLANAFVAGANDYITKPINRVELVARVRAALRLKQELDRRQARERELLNFVSNWGDRRASTLIDEATGLFVGEAAEAYLSAASGCESDAVISIFWRSHWIASTFTVRPTATARRRACWRRWRTWCAGSRPRSAPWRPPIATAPLFSSRPNWKRFPRTTLERLCARPSRSCGCRIPKRLPPTTSPPASRRLPGG